MRLFTAIELPQEVRNHLSGIQTFLHSSWPEIRDVKWVDPANLHVTLKFLGEVEEARLPEVKGALSAVRVEPMTLCADRFIRLPRRGPARVLAVEFAGDVGRVAQLFGSIELAVEDLGFRRERRPFRAHATLGRARDGVREYDVFFGLELPEHLPGPMFEATSFSVFKSTLTPAGPIYENLARFGA